MKSPNKSILILFILLVLGFLHTLPLWNLRENLAGGYGDPLAHAGIGQWYCANVLRGDFISHQFFAPFGADVSGAYDSPFPFVLTCPFFSEGPLFQFHLFTLLQVLLIILGAWLVATCFIKNSWRQMAYVLFVWWCGFYIARSHQHVTLLSMIWGTQFVFYALMSLNLQRVQSVLGAGLLVGLSFTGTFQNIPALFVVTGALVSYRLWQERGKLNDKSVLRNLFFGAIIALGIFLALWWPMIVYTLKNGPFLVDTDRRAYNLDLMSVWIPFDTHLIYEWGASLRKLPLERQNAFDPLVLIIAVVSFLKKDFWKDSFRILLLVLAVVYFVLALGPELRFNDELISYLDFNSEMFRLFPFSVTRTPGRLALMTNLCLILLVFLFIEKSREGRWKKYLSVALVPWAVLMGPGLNQMWLFPTLKYTEILNMKALGEIRNLSSDKVVVHIPTAWGQDPAQNFQQLFHGKRITSGYLSYTSYNNKVREQFMNEPFLGKLGCDGEATAFVPTGLMASESDLHRYLKAQRYEIIIINKMLLLGNPACAKLTLWVQQFVKYPWVKPLEENNLFLTLAIQ